MRLCACAQGKCWLGLQAHTLARCVRGYELPILMWIPADWDITMLQQRTGGPTQLLLVTASYDKPLLHVLAGDIPDRG
jgi:hypothetical protein